MPWPAFITQPYHDPLTVRNRQFGFGSSLSGKSTVQFRHHRPERYTEGLAPGMKFDDVQAPFAALDLADGGLRHSELLGKLDLRDPAARPRLGQKFQEHRVLICMDRFRHSFQQY